MPDGPITDVNSLTLVSGAVAAPIKAAAGIDVTATPRFRTDAVPPTAITKPGVERWPVKTGRDADRNAQDKRISAASSAPAIRAAMNPGASIGLRPEKLTVSACASGVAGSAKLVDRSYAARAVDPRR